MKQIILFLIYLVLLLASCGSSLERKENNSSSRLTAKFQKMKIIIGSTSFTATLHDNETARAFRKLLPLTLKMTELNGNEKFADLKKELPVDAYNPGKIQNGDLLLYGSNTLVVFYKSFNTSYSYTKLGKIDNPEGLAAALGSRDITVSFE